MRKKTRKVGKDSIITIAVAIIYATVVVQVNGLNYKERNKKYFNDY